MKKLLGGLMLGLVVAGMTSCSNVTDPLEDGNHRSHKLKNQPIKKTIRMAFGGDYVSESEEPLLRAEDGEKFTAVNVFRTEKDKEGAQEEKYAYGLFKNKDEVSIDVVTGFTYRFESSILIEKEDILYFNNNQYSLPFQYNSSGNPTGSNTSYHTDKLDKFQYTTTNSKGETIEDRNRNYFTQLQSGTTNIRTSDLSAGNGRAWYPRVKRYYGTYSSFDPGLSETVDINMAYKCFGLKIVVVDLPGGHLTVKDITKDGIRDKSEEQLLIIPKNLELALDKTKEWECVYSMNKLLSESETFNLEFTWHKGGNVTEKFTTEVTVKPKTKKVLRLNVNGNPNYETKGNIKFIMDSEDLVDDVQEVNKDLKKDTNE
ncbi:MAG: hypothetical protein K2I92_04925 [Muribaculaceae bacterium]|nr:hypothetical protein [Muribaculaceae bacterium]